MSMHQEINNFSVAMGFMTRLGPARVFAPEEMAGSLRHFTLVGLIIGCLATIPLHILFGTSHANAQAWIWVALSIWLTRALHWDGWADLWDAWGSCAQGDRFWAIMKDSHIGAFGVIGLVMGLAGQLLFAGELISSPLWTTLIWAPAFGRAAASLIASLGTAPSTSTLGKLFLAGASPGVVVVQTISALIVGIALCGIKPVVFTIIIAGFGVYAFVSLSRKQGGLNGDFLGATVIWGELSALLGATLCLV